MQKSEANHNLQSNFVMYKLKNNEKTNMKILQS